MFPLKNLARKELRDYSPQGSHVYVHVCDSWLTNWKPSHKVLMLVQHEYTMYIQCSVYLRQRNTR